MYNLLLSLAAAALALLVFGATGLVPWWGAVLPATVALGGTYFVLARRTLKQLEALMLVAQKDLAAQRIEPGLAILREGFSLSKWQFFVAPQVHAQIGMLLYMLKRFDEALPHLQKAFVRVGQAQSMLAALYFQRKDYEAMEKAFEAGVRHSKKDGFLWSTYAWCLDKSDQRAKALSVLARGLQENPSDEKLKANQLALQNNERMRMRGYGHEWWGFHLETPPKDVLQSMNPQMQGQRKGYRTPRGR